MPCSDLQEIGLDPDEFTLEVKDKGFAALRVPKSSCRRGKTPSKDTLGRSGYAKDRQPRSASHFSLLTLLDLPGMASR